METILRMIIGLEWRLGMSELGFQNGGICSESVKWSALIVGFIDRCFLYGVWVDQS